MRKQQMLYNRNYTRWSGRKHTNCSPRRITMDTRWEWPFWGLTIQWAQRLISSMGEDRWERWLAASVWGRQEAQGMQSGPCPDFSLTESNLWVTPGQSGPTSYTFPGRRGCTAYLHLGPQRRGRVIFSKVQRGQTSLVPPHLPLSRATPSAAATLPRRFLWSSWICLVAWVRFLERAWVGPPSCRCASGDPGPSVHSTVWIWHGPVEINSDSYLLVGARATTRPTEARCWNLTYSSHVYKQTSSGDLIHPHLLCGSSN